jgi:hypothetical protein
LIHSLLQIHIILGLADLGQNFTLAQRGVMADVKAASSDPIFLNHHAMIDCILEEWLQRNTNPQYPMAEQIHRGHKANDYMVPFFPLVKHSEMFMTAENFGYTCRLPRIDTSNPPNRPNPPNNPNPGNTAIKSGPTLWLFIPVVIGMGLLFIQQY